MDLESKPGLMELVMKATGKITVLVAKVNLLTLMAMSTMATG